MKCVIQGKVSGKRRRHTAVTSQNGCLKTWSESRGKHGVALDAEDWYDGRLIITPDGTAKEEECHRRRAATCSHVQYNPENEKKRNYLLT